MLRIYLCGAVYKPRQGLLSRLFNLHHSHIVRWSYLDNEVLFIKLDEWNSFEAFLLYNTLTVMDAYEVFYFGDLPCRNKRDFDNQSPNKSPRLQVFFRMCIQVRELI